MKILFGLLGVAAVAYVVSRIVVHTERTKERLERDEDASWPLGDPRLRGFVETFRMN